MKKCYCGLENEFEKCCEPFILGEKKPPTAESTMRARYSAYATGNIDFIKSTHHPKTRDEFDLKSTKDWANQSKWLGLTIKNTEDGEKDDLDGVVEFIAEYEFHDEKKAHHEISEFKKVDDVWYFYDGKTFGETVEREGPKVGRNDPCPCGSGKKYKKCCL